MSTVHSAKKSRSGAPGAKALITAASLAITLGGWAAFARSNADTSDSVLPEPAIALGPPRLSTDLNLAPQLLPTIVPAPRLPPKLTIAQPPDISAALLSDSAPPVAQAAASPPRADLPAADQPAAPAAPPAAIQMPAVTVPPLRVVSAPPQPIARTRSSK